MADEFAKGLGILTTAGLIWMVLAGWYRTPSFESTHQLVSPITISEPSVYESIAIVIMNGSLWFAIIGTLTFWVVIPLVDQLRVAVDERRS
jgi:hypothetical protein